MDYMIFEMYMPFVLSIGAYSFSKNKPDWCGRTVLDLFWYITI